MTGEFLNVRLPTPEEKYSAQNERELRRQIELAFKQVSSSSSSSSSATADGIYAVEAYLWNNGSTIIAGDSDWVYVPSDFTITDAEIVSDPAGTISVEVYASAYATWDTFTKISGSAPITLTASDKNRPSLTGWTVDFTGGTYLRFTITGTPTSITKATVTLNLNVVNASLASLTDALYAAAINRANHTGTQLAATISDFDSATRAQVESELVAGSNITITPGSSGATRTLTVAATIPSSLTVKDEGTNLSTAVTSLNFVGAGVTATGTTAVTVTVPSAAITVKDEGSTLSSAVTSIDFVGSGVTATNVGGAVTATITSGTTLAVKYTVWDGMIPDSSPHADTDEFTSSSTISNWTGIYTGDASVVNDIATTQGRGMYFEAPSVNYRIRSRMKTIPVGDFTVHAAVVLSAHSPAASTIIGCGIMLADGVTAAAGKQTGIIAARAQGTANSVIVSGRLVWANYGNDATSAAFDTADFAHSISYLRLRRVGSTYSRAVSPDGENWLENTFTLLAGLTPTHYGLGFQNYGTVGTGSATVLFFRTYATGTQYKTGAMRTVYG